MCLCWGKPEKTQLQIEEIKRFVRMGTAIEGFAAELIVDGIGIC